MVFFVSDFDFEQNINIKSLDILTYHQLNFTWVVLLVHRDESSKNQEIKEHSRVCLTFTVL